MSRAVPRSGADAKTTNTTEPWTLSATEALAAFRSSAFLTENLGYYDVGEGCHELVTPGCSKGTGARALLEALPERPSRVSYALRCAARHLPSKRR